ncbi:MAG: DNA polymerase IV [Armatimonadota bacterium]
MFPANESPPEGPRTILHVDMDAFFASVEQRLHPEFAGKPVIVGGTRSRRGVVSSASYEARPFGVKAGMPIWQARRRCPQGIFLPGHFDAYAEDGRRALHIYERYTPCLEPLGVDEAFLDVTHSQNLFGSGWEIAREIKRRVREELGLTASIGVAPNRLLAKMASGWDKPDGLRVIEPEEVPAVLDRLPVSALWGVGENCAERLRRMGVRTVRDLRGMPLLLLEKQFGAHGRHLYNACRGIDRQPVHPRHRFRPAKSMSHEVTLERDTRDPKLLRLSLLALSEKLARRLRHQGYRGRTIGLKLRLGNFTTLTRSTTLPDHTNLEAVIYRQAAELLAGLRLGPHGVRLVGVSVSNLRHGPMHVQMSLFDLRSQRLQGLAAAKDAIDARFGDQAVTRGSLLGFTHRVLEEAEDSPHVHA